MGLRVGDQVGDYEVVGMLGAGGMGAVYQVRHLISDRIEAVKILLPDLASTPELADRFMREIRLHASLNHANIAALHNALRVDNQLLMVMEYVDGQTLADVIRRGPLRPLQAIDAGAQILSALDYAHSRGVVHRDVKPSNVILTMSGTVKLMDFGIARGSDEFGVLTQAGAAIGSMYYMSPEQISGAIVDGRSDVYATGVTLYEVVTGQRPIKGRTAGEVMEAHMRDQPANPRLLNPAIPEELAQCLLRALQKNAADRYSTAGEFRDDLLRVQAVISNPGQTQTLALLAASRERTPTSAPTPTPSSTPASTPARTTSQTISFDPLGLDRLRKDLAQHIGPVAKVLVDRAAKRSRTWQELYTQLASGVPAGKDRERFLAGCPRA